MTTNGDVLASQLKALADQKEDRKMESHVRSLADGVDFSLFLSCQKRSQQGLLRTHIGSSFFRSSSHPTTPQVQSGPPRTLETPRAAKCFVMVRSTSKLEIVIVFGGGTIRAATTGNTALDKVSVPLSSGRGDDRLLFV